MGGWNESIKAIQLAKCKLILMANNTPGLRRSELEYYCMLGRVPVIHYEGNNNDLGRTCGKLFATSVMSVIEPGDSDLIKVIHEWRAKQKARRKAVMEANNRKQLTQIREEKEKPGSDRKEETEEVIRRDLISTGHE